MPLATVMRRLLTGYACGTSIAATPALIGYFDVRELGRPLTKVARHLGVTARRRAARP
jgi:hypothetical protein